MTAGVVMNKQNKKIAPFPRFNTFILNSLAINNLTITTFLLNLGTCQFWHSEELNRMPCLRKELKNTQRFFYV